MPSFQTLVGMKPFIHVGNYLRHISRDECKSQFSWHTTCLIKVQTKTTFRPEEPSACYGSSPFPSCSARSTSKESPCSPRPIAQVDQFVDFKLEISKERDCEYESWDAPGTYRTLATNPHGVVRGRTPQLMDGMLFSYGLFSHAKKLIVLFVPVVDIWRDWNLGLMGDSVIMVQG